VCRLC